MSTYSIIDANGKVLASGEGPAMFARRDLLSQPGNTLRKVAAEKRVGEVTDTTAQARVEADRAALVAAGIALPETWYTPGADMMDLGESRYHAKKLDYDNSPLFVDAAQAAIARIEAQKRKDHVIAIGETPVVRVDPQGLLVVGEHKIRMTADGLVRLLGWFPEVFPAASRWALQMGVSALSAAVTDGFERWAAMCKQGMKPRRIQMRVRSLNDGSRALWAVVGPRYPGRVTDADAVLRKMVAHAPTGLRGTVTLDPNTSRMVAEAVQWNEHIGPNPKVGDIFRAFHRAVTRDDGQGSYRGAGGVEGIRCVNCTTDEVAIEGSVAAHRSAETLLGAVEHTMTANPVNAIIERFTVVQAKPFALASTDDNGDDVVYTQPDEVFSAICRDGDLLAEALKNAGIERDIAVEALLSAHTSEMAEGRMDGTLADTARSVARAAQDRRFDVFQRAALENASGTLLRILADGSIEA